LSSRDRSIICWRKATDAVGNLGRRGSWIRTLDAEIDMLSCNARRSPLPRPRSTLDLRTISAVVRPRSPPSSLVWMSHHGWRSRSAMQCEKEVRIRVGCCDVDVVRLRDITNGHDRVTQSHAKQRRLGLIYVYQTHVRFSSFSSCAHASSEHAPSSIRALATRTCDV
jgi:hypothetical protein